MARLHLRNVPSEVDAALAAAVRAHGISKNQCAIEALRHGLGVDQGERSQLVATIRHARQAVDVDLAKLARGERRTRT